MTAASDWTSELPLLLERLIDGQFTAEDGDRLNSLLAQGAAQRHYYRSYLKLHAALEWRIGEHNMVDGLAKTNACAADRQSALPPAAPMAIPSPSYASVALPSVANYSVTGYFASGWPVAYLLATVIFGVGLLVGAIVHVSPPNPLATQPVPGSSLPVAPIPSKGELVGRISGMADCQWTADGAKSSPLVALGDTFRVSSGLLEITYDTGARVILQGPVTYKVESSAGGYLSIGKLTAKLETEVRGQKSEVRGQRSASENQKSEVKNHQFAVRTPTAIVTDLGTEFGVEVDASGATRSEVFRGSVKVRVLSARNETGEIERVLHENEATRIGDDSQRTILVVPVPRASGFVREMPKQTIKTLDLADVVAGGDGFSGKRGRGIDPTTGLASNLQPEDVNAQGDYKYHRVEGVPYVDGIFIPDGSKGPVQIDSAGHTFPDCPKTDNCSWAYVWAGGKLPPAIGSRMSATLAGVDYSSPGHALLVIHANKGITFDLDAIRRRNPRSEVLRFRATAGNVETESERGTGVSADIWVLVDGEVRFKRREFNRYNGAVAVVVPVHDSDRFLTLAVTDAGNSYMCDQILFGDPKLELAGPKTPANNATQLP
jgi:hypothetical protein